MRLENGSHTYEIVEGWGVLPEGIAYGYTHGVVVDSKDRVYIHNQSKDAIIVFDSEGNFLNSWGEEFKKGAHGMYLSTEGQYSPTWVAVNEERYGGNGDIWVADGYGMSYVHRYDKMGRYFSSINGEEGSAGIFQCPHGIWIDTRNAGSELYIADRGNRRFQVYDLHGNYKRVFGSDILSCPCGCITYGELLMIPELSAKVTILDANDRLVCYLGENEKVCKMPGWPNHTSELITPGKFNSPHAMAVDEGGNLYVVEWIIGGRVTKLTRCCGGSSDRHAISSNHC